MATEAKDGVSEATCKYAGADWLRQQGIKLSPLGEKVADILGTVFQGLYHLDHDGIRKVKWDDTYLIQVKHYGGLATWDFNSLTQLVVLCHDACIRLDISPRNMQYLGLMFHQRQGREGRYCERHPTIEEHIAMIRPTAPACCRAAD